MMWLLGVFVSYCVMMHIGFCVCVIVFMCLLNVFVCFVCGLLCDVVWFGCLCDFVRLFACAFLCVMCVLCL